MSMYGFVCVLDEDVDSSKIKALVVRGEGGLHYPDSYCSSLQDGGGGHHSFASFQCSAPPSLTAVKLDAGVARIPGGLQQYRASIKPLMGYGGGMEHPTCSLHRYIHRFTLNPDSYTVSFGSSDTSMET